MIGAPFSTLARACVLVALTSARIAVANPFFLEETELVASDLLHGDRFGDAIAMHRDKVIVGTWLKEGGRVAAPVDPARVERLRRVFDAVRA